jgi:hypothetical protein
LGSGRLCSFRLHSPHKERDQKPKADCSSTWYCHLGNWSTQSIFIYLMVHFKAFYDFFFSCDTERKCFCSRMHSTFGLLLMILVI